MTNNEILPLSLVLSLIPTREHMPNVLELPKHKITNLKQWVAGVQNQDHLYNLKYHLTLAIHYYIPFWVLNQQLQIIHIYTIGSHNLEKPMQLYAITVIKNQFSQYNQAVTQGKQNGPTTQKIKEIIKKRFQQLPYPARQWVLQIADPPPYWNQQHYYIQCQHDQLRQKKNSYNNNNNN